MKSWQTYRLVTVEEQIVLPSNLHLDLDQHEVLHGINALLESNSRERLSFVS